MLTLGSQIKQPLRSLMSRNLRDQASVQVDSGFRLKHR